MKMKSSRHICIISLKKLQALDKKFLGNHTGREILSQIPKEVGLAYIVFNGACHLSSRLWPKRSFMIKLFAFHHELLDLIKFNETVSLSERITKPYYKKRILEHVVSLYNKYREWRAIAYRIDWQLLDKPDNRM